jgi:8-oxo-dGTP diphosphatase
VIGPVLCVGAVAVDRGQLLVVKRGRPPSEGEWSIPGGRVEAGEPIRQAVVREVKEETGVQCACGELIGWVERISPSHHYVILDFWVAADSLGPYRPGDDADEVAWVPIDDVSGLGLVEGLAAFLVEHGVLPPVD